jgi:TrmH family RNA methyltransferase
MTSLKTSPGLLALATMPDRAGRAEHSGGVWLYLDRMNDPGNVGTLVRVADWFGMAGVVMSSDSADPFGPKAVQSAMGSAFHTPIRIQNFKDLPSRWTTRVVGLDAGGQNLFELPTSEAPTLLVVGSESHGVSEDICSACHVMASIPGAGRAESLNASVAGAIAAASLVQQGVPMGQGR